MSCDRQRNGPEISTPEQYIQRLDVAQEDEMRVRRTHRQKRAQHAE